MSLHFATVLYVALLSLKLLNKSFKDLDDAKRRIQNSLAIQRYKLYWAKPGFDQIFTNVFLAGAKKLVRDRITTRPRVPLRTSQLFCIILALIPPNYQHFGIGTSPKDNFLSNACVISTILFLADGLRGGELLTKNQKNLTVKALRKIPKIRNLKLYFTDSPFFTRLSDFDNKRDQLACLRKILLDTSMYAILVVLFTKPGRHRRIAIKHFHVLNSHILCPLCNFAIYMIHRILQNTTHLHKDHYLFIFEGQYQNWYPLTDDIFNKTLLKCCVDIGFLKVTQSNFKIGILTELWESSIKEIIPFKPDLRFFLQVADHRTDYHQGYIIPDLLVICECLQTVREINLVRFLGNLSSIERADLILSIMVHLPMPVTNTSTSLSQKATTDKESLLKIGVRDKS